MRSKSVLALIALTALLMLPARHAFAGIYCQSLWASEMVNVKNYIQNCQATGEDYYACKKEPVVIGLLQDMALDYAGCMNMIANPNHPPILPSAAPLSVTCYWTSQSNGDWALLGCDVAEVDPRQLLPLRKSGGQVVDCSVPEHLLYRRLVRATQII
jgi:hypothetical protein